MAVSRGTIQEVLEQRSRNPYGLSDREMKIVKYLANGYSLNRIASLLGCANPTVKRAMPEILSLMECSEWHEIGPRWVREQELEPLRKTLGNTLSAIDASDNLGKLRTHPFVRRARGAA